MGTGGIGDTHRAPQSGNGRILLLVTDAALRQLRDLPGVERRLLQRTQVTAKRLADFQPAAPRCTMKWDGGTVEPKE